MRKEGGVGKKEMEGGWERQLTDTQIWIRAKVSLFDVPSLTMSHSDEDLFSCSVSVSMSVECECESEVESSEAWLGQDRSIAIHRQLTFHSFVSVHVLQN